MSEIKKNRMLNDLKNKTVITVHHRPEHRQHQPRLAAPKLMDPCLPSPIQRSRKKHRQSRSNYYNGHK
jgi:hypothetical protein